MDWTPHNAAFHQGQHYLLRQTRTSEKEIQYFLEVIICDPLNIYMLLYAKSIGLKRVDKYLFLIAGPLASIDICVLLSLKSLN